MLVFFLLKFVQLNGANAIFVREQMSEFVESNNFLVFSKKLFLLFLFVLVFF
jgi:hypothetical protein